nr:tetraacyldisaccharide 4'-kinase [Halomonas malpeensis]
MASRWLDAVYRPGGAFWLVPLYPLGALYRILMARRARAYATGRKAVARLPVPVIVVGNITLGGTGKSPLVAWLVRRLVDNGWTPGIVTRGYGGRAKNHPLRVSANTDPAECGDEPAMLFRQTGVAVVADPNRPRGARALVEQGCDIIVSDDGLQHLALGRDIEIVVVDGARGLGNRRCLPAGPLREPAGRLSEADAVIVTGVQATPLPVATQSMTLVPVRWRRVASGEAAPLAPLPFAPPVHAVAGIGHPARFFETLEALGVTGERHPLTDHHVFDATTLAFTPPRPVVMTAKDAIKCKNLAPADSWALEIEAALPAGFEAWLFKTLEIINDTPTRADNDEEGAHG